MITSEGIGPISFVQLGYAAIYAALLVLLIAWAFRRW